MDKQMRMLLTALPISALAVWSPCDAQTLPKQGSFDVTYEAVGSVVQSLDAGGGQSVNLYQATLVFANNPQTPLLNNISSHCVESAFTAAGDSGYCVFTDKDGDKFVETITRAAGQQAGTGSFGSGTGKFKGITGNVSWQPVMQLAADKGTFNFVGRKTGNYRLP
jgi:hypothetical protein